MWRDIGGKIEIMVVKGRTRPPSPPPGGHDCIPLPTPISCYSRLDFYFLATIFPPQTPGVIM